MNIKKLNSRDVALLKELLRVFGKVFDEPDTYQGKVPNDLYLESLLNNKDFIVLIALEENKIAGGLAAYVLNKFEQERKEIYIYDLAVLKQYRRRGIATGLINKLRAIAKEQRAYIIFVQADKDDFTAIKLYESLGKREEVYHFDIQVA